MAYIFIKLHDIRINTLITRFQKLLSYGTRTPLEYILGICNRLRLTKTILLSTTYKEKDLKQN